jgi:hypothetical protein
MHPLTGRLTNYRLANGDELRDLGRQPPAPLHGLRPRPSELSVDDRGSIGVERRRPLKECEGREGRVIGCTFRRRHDRLASRNPTAGENTPPPPPQPHHQPFHFYSTIQAANPPPKLNLKDTLPRKICRILTVYTPLTPAASTLLNAFRMREKG